MNRVCSLGAKAYKYLLESLDHPWFLPSIIWQTIVNHAHLGELLKLNQQRRWLQSAGIGTVIDVGANNGQFSSAICSILPGIQIIAFEPLPDSYKALCKKLKRHARFKAFQVALGEERNKIAFWRNRFAKASSILPMADLHKQAFPWTSSAEPINVEMHRLDDYCSELSLEPKVLLKIDVQGYEDKVLSGATNMLEKIEYVLVETSFKPLYDHQAYFPQIYSFLVAHGFEYAGCFEQMLSPHDGAILQMDGLFLRKQF